MEKSVLLIISIIIVVAILMIIWEIVDIMVARAWKKIRIQAERKAQKQKDLERLIRDIAHQEIILNEVKKMAFENALKGKK